MNFFNGVNSPLICGWYLISEYKMLVIMTIIIRIYLKNGGIFYSSLLSVNSISLVQVLDEGCALEV